MGTSPLLSRCEWTSATVSLVLPLTVEVIHVEEPPKARALVWQALWAVEQLERGRSPPTSLSEQDNQLFSEEKKNRTKNVLRSQNGSVGLALASGERTDAVSAAVTVLGELPAARGGGWGSVGGAAACVTPCTALAYCRAFLLLKELVLIIPTDPLSPEEKIRKEKSLGIL